MAAVAQGFTAAGSLFTGHVHVCMRAKCPLLLSLSDPPDPPVSPYDGITYASESLPELYANGVFVDLRSYNSYGEYIKVLQGVPPQLR